jgi:hypothetical protein
MRPPGRCFCSNNPTLQTIILLAPAEQGNGPTWLSPSQYIRQFVSDTGKPVSDWRATYSDSNDPVHFRRWLKMILTPEWKYDVGEGFGFSPVSHHGGL